MQNTDTAAVLERVGGIVKYSDSNIFPDLFTDIAVATDVIVFKNLPPVRSFVDIHKELTTDAANSLEPPLIGNADIVLLERTTKLFLIPKTDEEIQTWFTETRLKLSEKTHESSSSLTNSWAQLLEDFSVGKTVKILNAMPSINAVDGAVLLIQATGMLVESKFDVPSMGILWRAPHAYCILFYDDQKIIPILSFVYVL